jgi:transposase-like protein
MRKSEVKEERKCPKCGSIEGQMKRGNRQGSQRCVCTKCNTWYTLNPRPIAYSQEVRDLAIREYYSGVSARGVGKIHNMSKANVLNWIKKNGNCVDKF